MISDIGEGWLDVDTIKRYRVYATRIKPQAERFIGFMYSRHEIAVRRAEYRYGALLKPGEKIIVKEASNE